MQNVTIIGLGLIGGSIGLGLKRWSAQHDNALRITGYDADMDKQSLAKSKKAVDETTWSLGDAIRDADIVIVATPVGAMEELFTDIGPNLKDGAIVTDTGSTKVNVLEWASQAFPETVSFVGGHPMAGKSESLEAADADLFKGATWVVCPSPRADEAAIKNVLGLIAAVDAEAFFVDPAEHDSYVAGISHLPMVVAASLVQSVTTDKTWRDMSSLASTGFRDTTRLALGSPDMHRDIAVTNRESISRWIGEMINELDRFRTMLAEEDDESLRKQVHEYFVDAQDKRARAEVSPNRAAEQNPEGAGELKSETMKQSVSRMFLGGLGRRDRDKRR